ncbi:GHKL domain-containing protein [Clostridium taeniosporum]|uniref:GHKL domain-containing protein n=1 Tax=Clostridium taeniosporum TaxID=394958 RepID=A0A1D7XH20_9CLOT|nr:GHKL domain-containing protein [Clostridium taeniosporum]AOR22654.1 GHKL domain-containing protein [Clostridium taeniosporum]
MLNNFIINSIDTFNILYLYTTLTKRNNNILKLLLGVLFISILVTITEELGFDFIVIYIINIIMIKFIYKENLKEITLNFFLVALIDITLQLMLSLAINRFIYNYALESIIVEVIILILILILSKLNLLNIDINFKIINNSILICLILIFSVYSIVFKFIWSYKKIIILNNLFFDFLIIDVLVISQILIYMYLIKLIKEKEKFKISSEYNTVINEIIEEIKRRQHDFSNYKNTIKGIVEVLDEKEIKPAIINYMKDEDMSDNNINNLIYIDNIVIKSIIYRNICRSKQYNINFKYEIENNVLENILSYYEISNLLSNLLNNAFDEIIKNKCNKKNIDIKIFSEINQSHLIIKNQIVNHNNIDLNKIFKKGYSTKGNDKRGYGLYNVQEIVNSHKGHIKINIESEEIIFDICFNNS